MKVGTHAFTFVEVLAAMAFLALVIPVVVSALLASNRTAVTAERSAIAQQLGENEMGELMLAGAWATAPSKGDFGTEWPGYRWELTQSDWQSGTITSVSMTELTLDVYFTVQGQERSIRLTTLVNQQLLTQ